MKQLKITRAYIGADNITTFVIPLPEGDITEFLVARYGIDALPLIITEII